MTTPVVSVVMSVFNGEAFLKEAVDSILAQTFREFEFIIVDDGSTDRTPEILKGYERADRRVCVLRQENKGRVASLNIGISRAVGGLVARMDADDAALPSRLEKQVAFMEENKDVGLLGGAFEVMNARGEILRMFRPPVEDAELKAILRRYNPLCHPTVIMRKETLLAAGGYRRIFGESEDYDLWLRISERSRVASLRESVLRYRVHPAQVSVRKMKYQTECLLAAQVSAQRRMHGDVDPLSGAEEITPGFLVSLGVTDRDIQQYLVGAHGYWMTLLSETEPEAALQISREVLRLCRPDLVGKVFVANAWLTAADIQYRQKRPGQALLSVGRALVTRPAVAGRPLKRCLSRLIRVFKAE